MWSLFADSLSILKRFAAQSLSRFATAPFTQGSPCRVPLSVRTPCNKQLYKVQFIAFLNEPDKHVIDTLFLEKGVITMEELLNILTELHPDVDFETEDRLVDG